MHTKHRNGPGNGYRANVMGMSGIAGSSRIFPEVSMRGHRMYNNSEYRNYGRGGYGRGGHSKQFQPPRGPTSETDIFVEAGRLAAEYLVSKGVLPPIALSGKWHCDALKNQLESFEGFRQRKAESSEGRVSVHSRLGNAAPDRRRYSDEYNAVGTRSSLKGRKRTESLKFNGPEANRDLERTGSLSEGHGVSPDVEGNASAFVGDDNVLPTPELGKCGLQSSSLGTNQEISGEAHLNFGLMKGDVADFVDSKDASSSNEVLVPSDCQEEPLEESHDVHTFNDELKAGTEGLNNQKHDENEGNVPGNDHVDLLNHCKFVNLPTKPRSSMTSKGSKIIQQQPMNEDKSNSRSELLEGSGVQLMDINSESSICNDLSNQKHDYEGLHSNALDSSVVEINLDVEGTANPEQKRVMDGLPECGISNSILIERGEKRTLDCDADDIENFKRIRQWMLPLDMQSDCISQLYTSKDNQAVLKETGTSKHPIPILCDDQKSLDISLSPKGHKELSQFTKEKLLFPASFKTCDLNLNENHEADPMLVFSPSKQIGDFSKPIDVDLSISNSCNLPITDSKHGFSKTDIEVIDLEKDTATEDQTFGNSERRGDAMFNELHGFSNANVQPDGHDGYGLMISELLGNDIQNCSSVSTDLNSLHNHMVLPNTEGILGDDDSIYMSLGEIPISLLGAWEHPSQDYGKPF